MVLTFNVPSLLIHLGVSKGSTEQLQECGFGHSVSWQSWFGLVLGPGAAGLCVLWMFLYLKRFYERV